MRTSFLLPLVILAASYASASPTEWGRQLFQEAADVAHDIEDALAGHAGHKHGSSCAERHAQYLSLIHI